MTYAGQRGYYRRPSASTPASQGQKNFIRSLLADKAVSEDDLQGYLGELDGLGKMRATEILDDLKALPNKILSPAEIAALEAGDYDASERQFSFFRSLLGGRELGDEDRGLLAGLRDSRRVGRAIDLLLSLPEIGGAADSGPSAGYLAQVGERVKDLAGEVVLVRDIQSRFGFSKLLVVKLDSGHLVKTFSSAASVLDSDFVAGDRIDILAGTVKAHEEYKGQEQTMLTRVKVAQKLADEGGDEGDGGTRYSPAPPGFAGFDPAETGMAGEASDYVPLEWDLGQAEPAPKAPAAATPMDELDRLLAEFDK
jgi:hypothetical protein